MSAASDHRLHELWTLGTTGADASWEALERREGVVAARRMFARRGSDRAFLASLRTLLASRGPVPVSRLDDRELVALAQRMVARGQLRVLVQRRRDFTYEQQEVEESAIGPAPVVEVDDLVMGVETELPGEDLVLQLQLTGVEAVALEAEHAGTPSPFGPDSDLADQVAALRDAAEDGAPFCEECEKARRAAEAGEPPEEEVAALDAPTQAAALRAAAKDGVPFCAECEKAKRAAAAAAAKGGP